MTDALMPAPRDHAQHRLAWLDQLAFELNRATGRNQLMQCIWIYDRPVDEAALVRMNERLVALMFNRLVERSPLPWGRPRWVRPAGLPLPLETSADVLPRDQLLQWANRHARAPIDVVAGPAWRMAVQRFADGSTAVSAVGSHVIIDGMGSVRALDAAARGMELPGSYQAQGSRRWLDGCLSDARQVLADAPRSLSALARLARAGRRRPSAPEREGGRTADDMSGGQELVDLPAVAVSIDAEAWDACARRLHGRPHALFPGFVATLAAHLGRCRSSDGAVSLVLPIDRRGGLEDDRAVAIEFRAMTIAPAGLATNLRPVNVMLAALLRSARDGGSDALAPLLPAISWMPRRLATALVERMFTYADERPVSCSNLGTLPESLALIDGAPCLRMLTRAVDVNVTRRDLMRSHGHLVVVGSRRGGTVSLCIEACQLEPTLTTVGDLRRVTSQTLADFGLDAVIEA